MIHHRPVKPPPNDRWKTDRDRAFAAYPFIAAAATDSVVYLHRRSAGRRSTARSAAAARFSCEQPPRWTGDQVTRKRPFFPSRVPLSVRFHRISRPIVTLAARTRCIVPLETRTRAAASDFHSPAAFNQPQRKQPGKMQYYSFIGTYRDVGVFYNDLHFPGRRIQFPTI